MSRPAGFSQRHYKVLIPSGHRARHTIGPIRLQGPSGPSGQSCHLEHDAHGPSGRGCHRAPPLLHLGTETIWPVGLRVPSGPSGNMSHRAHRATGQLLLRKIN